MTPAAKLAAFFALLDKRQAQERKEAEDRKIARLRPWWLDACQ